MKQKYCHTVGELYKVIHINMNDRHDEWIRW